MLDPNPEDYTDMGKKTPRHNSLGLFGLIAKIRADVRPTSLVTYFVVAFFVGVVLITVPQISARFGIDFYKSSAACLNAFDPKSGDPKSTVTLPSVLTVIPSINNSFNGQVTINGITQTIAVITSSSKIYNSCGTEVQNYISNVSTVVNAFKYSSQTQINGIQGYDQNTGVYTNNQAAAGKFLILYGLFAPSSNTVALTSSTGQNLSFSSGISGFAQTDRQINVPLPTTLATGTYTAKVSNAGGIGNPSSSFTISSTAPQPDYVVQSLQANGSLGQGSLLGFQGTVRNQGSAGTSNSSQTRLRIDVGNNGSWDVTPSNKTTGGLATSGTKIESWTGVWTSTTGTHKYEICADAGLSPAITESSETNNCTSATFTVLSTSKPDLIASNPSPATATAGVAQTFTSTISNSASVSTVNGFSNFFQVASAANGGGTITDLSATTMSVLAAWGTGVTSKTHTFTTAGTYSVRVCADKTSSTNTGAISESSETNNCSGWTNVTVLANACVNRAFNQTTSGLFNAKIGGNKITTVSPGQQFYAKCDYGIVQPYMGVSSSPHIPCPTWEGWDYTGGGVAATYGCTAPTTPGTYAFTCIINSNTADTTNSCSESNPMGSITVSAGFPMTVTVTASTLYARYFPYTQSPSTVWTTMHQGGQFVATGATYGETINGENRWWVLQGPTGQHPLYAWAGGTDASSLGASNINHVYYAAALGSLTTDKKLKEIIAIGQSGGLTVKKYGSSGRVGIEMADPTTNTVVWRYRHSADVGSSANTLNDTGTDRSYGDIFPSKNKLVLGEATGNVAVTGSTTQGKAGACTTSSGIQLFVESNGKVFSINNNYSVKLAQAPNRGMTTNEVMLSSTDVTNMVNAAITNSVSTYNNAGGPQGTVSGSGSKTIQIYYQSAPKIDEDAPDSLGIARQSSSSNNSCRIDLYETTIGEEIVSGGLNATQIQNYLGGLVKHEMAHCFGFGHFTDSSGFMKDAMNVANADSLGTAPISSAMANVLKQLPSGSVPVSTCVADSVSTPAPSGGASGSGGGGVLPPPEGNYEGCVDLGFQENPNLCKMSDGIVCDCGVPGFSCKDSTGLSVPTPEGACSMSSTGPANWGGSVNSGSGGFCGWFQTFFPGWEYLPSYCIQ